MGLDGVRGHADASAVAAAGALQARAFAYGTDVERAQEVIKQVADEVHIDPDWRRLLLETPEVWGGERLGADAISVRPVVKTRPGEQYAVMRELRRRLSDGFDSAGIEVPAAARHVWVPRDAGSSRDAAITPTLD